MFITIQSPHQQVSEKVKRMIERKFRRLNRMYDQIENIKVVLKSSKNDKSDSCAIEARVAVPGNDLFAMEAANEFPVAAELVCIDLEHQLARQKGRFKIRHSEALDRFIDTLVG